MGSIVRSLTDALTRISWSLHFFVKHGDLCPNWVSDLIFRLEPVVNVTPVNEPPDGFTGEYHIVYKKGKTLMYARYMFVEDDYVTFVLDKLGTLEAAVKKGLISSDNAKKCPVNKKLPEIWFQVKQQK